MEQEKKPRLTQGTTDYHHSFKHNLCAHLDTSYICFFIHIRDINIKNLPVMQEPQERWVWSLGQEDPLEEGMSTHSSIRAWRIPGIEEPGGLQSIESQRVGHEWSDLTEDVEEVCKNSWSFARTDTLMTQEGNRLLFGSEENTPVHFSSPRACCVIERTTVCSQWCHLSSRHGLIQQELAFDMSVITNYEERRAGQIVWTLFRWQGYTSLLLPCLTLCIVKGPGH